MAEAGARFFRRRNRSRVVMSKTLPPQRFWFTDVSPTKANRFLFQLAFNALIFLKFTILRGE